MGEIQAIAYVTKVLAIMFVIPLIYTSFKDLEAYIKVKVRQDSVYEKLEGYYSFGMSKQSIKYLLDLGTDNYIALKQEIVEKNDLFSFGKAFHMEGFDYTNPEVRDRFYVADENYLLQHNLIDDKDWLNDICIFVFEDTVESIAEIKRKVIAGVRNPSEYQVHLIELDKPLETYSIDDLLFTDTIDTSLYMVYYPTEKGLEGQLNQNWFTFEGTSIQAEEYIDQLFNKYGYVGAFQIDSIQSSYYQYSTTMLRIYSKGMRLFIILVLAYFFSNRFLVETDIDNNRKRYAIAMIEGISPYSFVVYLVKIASCALVALVLCLLSKRIYVDETIVYVVAFIALMEMIFYIIFMFRYRKIKRGER